MTNKQTRSGESQLNFLDEIIVDNFAGGGGASTGMELATGRPVAIAINHDPDAILLLEIGGGLYFIADILLRMLTPRELYNAMGFPPDYIIDRDYLGNEYGKTKQVARCGNAVCPPMATALVRANLPEWCSRTITTMEELEKAVTA